jgi:hypothetical protein
MNIIINVSNISRSNDSYLNVNASALEENSNKLFLILLNSIWEHIFLLLITVAPHRDKAFNFEVIALCIT